MSTLIVVAYDDVYKAQEMRVKLVKLQKDYLVDLEDAVTVIRDENGKVKLHQILDLPAMGAFQGGFLGTLIGCLFFAPIFGMAIGAASGALTGALTDVGINDQFMKDLGNTLKPGTSALCVLIREATMDKVLAEIEGTGGTVLKTNLTKEDETKLQAALSHAKTEHASTTAGVSVQT